MLNYFISVPSSSGRSLQLLGQTPSEVHFNYFSPLFIGEVSSTQVPFRGNQFGPVFQSPLHRGGLFNGRAHPGAERGEPISVPSSSGRSLQRLRLTHDCIQHLRFQSPLHRGGLFNIRAAPNSAPAQHFSPLFIGEVSSTDRMWPRYHRSGQFQSPLHRGGLFNHGGIILALGKRDISVPSSSGRSLQLGWHGRYHHGNYHFSPLFIGEVSSTWIVGSGICASSPFQSPLHRGGLFNGVTGRELEALLLISVPSSSGRSLQRGGGRRARRKRRYFSPLFIGEVSSTKNFSWQRLH